MSYKVALLGLMVFFSAPLFADDCDDCPSTVCSSSDCDDCSNDNDCSSRSHTVFVPRSITHDSVYDLALNNYDFYHPISERKRVSLYITPFYQQSFHGSKNAPYFLLNGKECIKFAQDGSGDVNPMWLDLIEGNGLNFSSTISVEPSKKVYGANIALFIDLQSNKKGWWFELAFTPMGTTQNLHLCETNITGNGDPLIPGITNGIQALSNPALLFGKFSPCSMKKGGVDDIQVKIGWNKFFRDGDHHIGLYAVGTIPTGSKRRNAFIFQPRVGTRNGALGAGVNADVTLWESASGNSALNFMSDFKYRYLFRSHECRSFDLCANGPWSRFLQVVTSAQPSNPMPGINTCFTQEAEVTPRSQIEWWNAFHGRWGKCHIELGWDFWYRQSEKVEIENLCDCNVGIYDLGADAQRQNARHQQVRNPISASMANISQSVFPPNAVPSDATFTNVGPLDTESGAHPRAISNKIYLSFAHDFFISRTPSFLGLGASAEFAHRKSAFNFWAVWAKWGLEF